ncbi:MAG: 16S rRNA (cytosine(1402)-N(4))-methyltransferase RsmH [Proteobacteria bacterium]|nr:16S rRNA (cytosine(1402)-N(4))-methyltransferase RsmH [Pseudomonadota bacterium]
MSEQQAHRPVMLREVIEALAPQRGGIYIDGTFGRGGYTRAILEAGADEVIGIDRDPQAIEAGQALVAHFAPRLRLVHGAFGNMEQITATQGVNKVDGIALDLGVSSPQLNEAERGFSFQKDGPLDMRMSKDGQTAAEIVNTYDEKELADILYTFGDERFSRRIARHIVEIRAKAPLTRTTELANLIRSVLPRSRDGIDPATRSFQALRIAVNDEMGELKRGIAAAEILLKPQGRLVIVSFHSLEDRCVKEFLRARSGEAPQSSRHLPANDSSAQPTLDIITRKPLGPSEEETLANPRARSAKLRVAERTTAPCPTETAA